MKNYIRKHCTQQNLGRTECHWRRQQYRLSGLTNLKSAPMAGKGKAKVKQQRRALSVLEKHQICKSDWNLGVRRKLLLYSKHTLQMRKESPPRPLPCQMY